MTTRIIPVCLYCDEPGLLTGGKAIYPHRPDLYHKQFYRCLNCPDVYVGCHADGRPLGVMADKEHRELKKKAHAKFDVFWKTGKMKRTEAYKRLSKDMETPGELTHIGMFSKEQCKKVVEVVSRWEN